jgi:hypothetical protein
LGEVKEFPSLDVSEFAGADGHEMEDRPQPALKSLLPLIPNSVRYDALQNGSLSHFEALALVCQAKIGSSASKLF